MNGSSVNVVNAVRGHASAVRRATVADVGAAAGLAPRYVRDVHVGRSFCARAIKISAGKVWAWAAWGGSEALGAVDATGAGADGGGGVPVSVKIKLPAQR